MNVKLMHLIFGHLNETNVKERTKRCTSFFAGRICRDTFIPPSLVIFLASQSSSVKFLQATSNRSPLASRIGRVRFGADLQFSMQLVLRIAMYQMAENEQKARCSDHLRPAVTSFVSLINWTFKSQVR